MALTEDECLAYLEKIKWAGKPTCPYCGSMKASCMKSERRYHCNHCFTSYRVTVNTIFHHSHVKLTKWFKSIYLVASNENTISARTLAKEICVSKNTALSMKNRILHAKVEEAKDILLISEFYRVFLINNGNIKPHSPSE